MDICPSQGRSSQKKKKQRRIVRIKVAEKKLRTGRKKKKRTVEDQNQRSSSTSSVPQPNLLELRASPFDVERRTGTPRVGPTEQRVLRIFLVVVVQRLRGRGAEL